MVSDSGSTHKYAILLVDDNVHGLVARRRVLMELGYLVQTARCAEEAWTLITGGEQFFDVLVTDYKMISMDGIELIKRVRQASPRTRSVLLSGFVLPLGLTEASTGADAVLPKSNVEGEQLTRTVKKLLTRKKPAKRQTGEPPQAMGKIG